MPTRSPGVGPRPGWTSSSAPRGPTGQVTDTRRNGYRVIRRAGRHTVFLDAPAQELLHRAGRRDGLLEVWNGLPFFTPLWARGRRATFIHHVHADMWRQVMTPGLARLGEALELRVAPRLYQHTRVLTPSPSSRLLIIERLGLPAANVTTVPNGVDEQFRPGGTRSTHPGSSRSAGSSCTSTSSASSAPPRPLASRCPT